MARSLGLRVVAEGVERADQFAFLRSRNCDEAQGFYFSRPADEMSRGLAGGGTVVMDEPPRTV